MSFFQFRLATRVGLWLCTLPITVRIRALPVLLERLTLAGERSRSSDSLGLDRTVYIVVRICRMRLFDLPVFPRACLRRALALYHVLGRMGYPVEIHIGVRKDGSDLHGHSWVTLHGKSVGEKTPAESFRTIYSFPAFSRGNIFRKLETQPTSAV